MTLWFLDKAKRNSPRADEVLFIDAREIYNTVDRAHRDWTPQQIEFLANIVRLWRGEEPEFEQGSREMIDERFPDGAYTGVSGLCGVASIGEIDEQGWSLNPGRYVGVQSDRVDDDEFEARANSLKAEYGALLIEAAELEKAVVRVLDGAS